MSVADSPYPDDPSSTTPPEEEPTRLEPVYMAPPDEFTDDSIPPGEEPTRLEPVYIAPPEEPVYEPTPPEEQPTRLDPVAYGLPVEEPETSRPAPSAPAPAPQSGTPWLRYAMIGGGVFFACICALCLMLVVFAMATDDSESDEAAAAPTFTSEQGTPVIRTRVPEPDEPEGVDTSVMDLNVGDCFNDPEIDEDGLVRELEIVSCDQLHDREIFASLTYPGEEGAEFPGDDTFDEFWEEECTAEFEEYVGLSYADSVFLLSTLEPTERSWNSGDREILCILFDEDERLEGSMQGSER